MKNTLRLILWALLLLLLFSGISACSGTEEQNQNTNTEIDAGSDADRSPDTDTEESTCQDGVLNDLETDIDCGGLDCESCDVGANCDDNTDCKTGLCSLDGVCLAAPNCVDGLLNNVESDVDCGGPNCSSCPNENRCNIDTDCESGYCSVEGLCAAPTCDDIAQNGEETGVDCGGPECPSCPIGESCQEDSDCQSSSCVNTTCAAPTCDDGIQNGTETDIDCGGPECSGCEKDQSCLVDTDCLTLDCRNDNTCAPARWSTVSASYSGYTCATRTDGTLWCWGSNNAGQLGIDSTTDSLTPVRVGTDYNWSDVSVGADLDFSEDRVHTCAIRTDGSIWCWGFRSAALGLGPAGDIPPDSTFIPSRVGTDNHWKNISVAHEHTCATDDSNGLWCWGDNWYGEVQPESQQEHNTPYRVGTLGHTPIDTKGYHNCALGFNGYRSCWGVNWYGQIGNGEVGDEEVFITNTDRSWGAISAGVYNTCAINGSIYCWGKGGYGINGSLAQETSPTRVTLLSNWDQVSVNRDHACAIRDNKSLWCWGRNHMGQVAPSTGGSGIYEPRQYGSDTWETVSVGDNYTCAIGTDGSLWCWGLNDKGQLGDGTTTNRPEPFEVTLP